ncbi:hypothetical protein B0I35DRAFT_404969 [Stachybotrys elegans]|uniref:Uncharacterized protein n=1 Tax=Stachybotrys elegans TaxID=80388 RepID=A0A8K0T332_9HYPO|nr:hypothetical protein B0I35DRAFT_404969 [Stachybotrys elegans]
MGFRYPGVEYACAANIFRVTRSLLSPLGLLKSATCPAVDRRPSSVAKATTIEKCIEFALKGRWRYTGVEYAGEYFVEYHSGREVWQLRRLRYAMRRKQVYEDKPSYDPTRDQLIYSLWAYMDAL